MSAIPVTATCQLLAMVNGRKPQRYLSHWYNVEKIGEKRNAARRRRGSNSCWSEAASTAVSMGDECTSVVLGDHQAQETFFLSFFSFQLISHKRSWPDMVMADLQSLPSLSVLREPLVFRTVCSGQ